MIRFIDIVYLPLISSEQNLCICLIDIWYMYIYRSYDICALYICIYLYSTI